MNSSTLAPTRPIAVTCPHCQSRFAVPPSFAGKTGRCKACQGTLTIPTPNNGRPQNANTRISVACPRCKTGFQVPQSYAGKAGRCKNCQAAFTIPGGQRTLPPRPQELRRKYRSATNPSKQVQERPSALPFNRSNWTISGVYAHAWTLYKNNWLGLVGAMILAMLVTAAAQFIVGVPLTLALKTQISPFTSPFLFLVAKLTVTILTSALSMLVNMGLIALCLDLVQGRSLSLGRVFSQLNKFPKALVYVSTCAIVTFLLQAATMVTLGVLPGSVLSMLISVGTLFIINLWLFLTFYLFAPFEMTFNDDASALDSFRNSFNISLSQKAWVLFFVSLPAVLIGLAVAAFVTMAVASGGVALMWILAGLFFTVCVLGVAPYCLLSTSTLFLALRDGSEVE